MEQFSLEKYLENSSRKVVTRDGRPVRIICWDRQSSDDDKCIIGLVDYGVREDTMYFDKLGHYSTYSEGFNDLFFADEEELSEFEKQLGVYIYFPRLSSEFNEEEKKYIRDAANTLLDLARKEIEKENSQV